MICSACQSRTADVEIAPGEPLCRGCLESLCWEFADEIVSAIAATDADIALHESEAA